MSGASASTGSELRTVIRGVGAYLPEHIVSSNQIEELHGLDSGWCKARTGIVERHKAGPHELSFHLAGRAARRALADAQVSPDSIDLILFSSTWAELLYPSPGVFLQRELSISAPVPVIEVRAACAGFIAMLVIADPMLRSGTVRRVLCVAAERGHECEQNLRAAAPLFGDAAAAVLLESTAARGRGGLLYCRFYTAAAEAEKCMRSSGALALQHLPTELRCLGTEGTPVAGGATRAYWDGASIFRNAVERLGCATDEALAAVSLAKSDIDLYLYHQANKKILSSVCRQFSIPIERVAMNIEHVGNTSSASVPLLLAEAFERGEIRAGQTILLGAFGAGYAYGVAVYEVPAAG